MGLFVGTSGWDYKEWKGGFYPSELPERRFLEHYGRELTACEVNTTFHRLQSESSVRRWASSVPEGFRFAVKAHRRLTHRKQIQPPGEFLKEFLESIAPLGDRLACMLLQFPPFVERDLGSLAELVSGLPAELPFACEFRHPSWSGAAVEEAVSGHGGTVCLAETEGDVPDRLPAGRIAYVRLRAQRYEPEAREGWLTLLREEAEDRDVFAFAKHKDVPAGDPFTGVGFAQWLVRNKSRNFASEITGAL
jgi:uncharacterized protein YecE (DUF72 family)